MGTAVAYFLADSGFEGIVTVYEPDPTYEHSSTARSAAAIRQQFNLAVNVEMSGFGFEFFRALERDPPGLGLIECGYLVLAAPDGRDRLLAAHRRQVELGADIELLDVRDLAARFPWLVTDDVAAGCLGRSGEGWLDPRRALDRLRRAAAERGVRYVTAAVDRIHSDGDRLVAVSSNDGQTCGCDYVVDAAGRHAAVVARLAGVDLPLEARKRTAFVFRALDPPSLDVQLVDPTVDGRGIYVRPYDGDYVAVTAPPPERDGEAFDFEPDRWLFDDVIRPALQRRIRGFGDVELLRAWAGHYEMNTLDQNAIIGPHPRVENLLFACGFSGHGVMHAPAAGRGIAELVATGRYRTIDLSPFAFDRIENGIALDDVQPSERRQVRSGL